MKGDLFRLSIMEQKWGNQYPLLQIHVTADRALLHFFAEEGRPGWISRNPIDELDVDELVTFFESENGASIQVSKAKCFLCYRRKQSLEPVP